MKTGTDEEIKVQREIETDIESLCKKLMRMPCEEVAYGIIKMFMQQENPSDRLRDAFHDWLLSPENGEAKEKAMQRCFEEFLTQDFSESSQRLQVPVTM